MSEKREIASSSGIRIRPVYHKSDIAPDREIGEPGEFPFTRGIYPEMYRTRLWTMRQYAGFSTAGASNTRYHYLISQGVTGLSVAFDLPTQIGYDSDHEMAEGEVGRVGVAIDSLSDMRTLFKDIPLDQVTTSMTINSTASILLALYVALAKDQGVQMDKIGGTVQNDILKEFAARGTQAFPPRPSMRLVTDLIEWCTHELPRWNTISISGYHIREAGSTALQELALTLANGIAYVQAAIDRGLDVNAFGRRLSFFFNAHNDFFEEIAKFRAARTIWSSIMRNRFGATDPKALSLRFHTQTGGSTLTAQQPEINVTRVTLQALAAVLGGTQSLHTNGADEALSLPTELSARTALRTQQIIGYESGVTATADPLAGSYFVESMTQELVDRATDIIKRIDDMGGAVEAIDRGYYQDMISHSAYASHKATEDGSQVVVGVNRFQEETDTPPASASVSGEIEKAQIERLRLVRSGRDQAEVSSALERIRSAAAGDENLMPHILLAVEKMVTVGEISEILRQQWGSFSG